MKHYSISIPVLASSLNEKTRDVYLQEMIRAGIERVFISVCDFGQNNKNRLSSLKELAENCAFFKTNGIDAGVWVGTTIGHGVPLTGDDRKYTESSMTPLVNLAGEIIPDTRCPLDPVFQKEVSNYVADIAKIGVKTILLDDDFRLSQHGVQFCCACDRHMSEIQRICDENITREELKK